MLSTINSSRIDRIKNLREHKRVELRIVVEPNRLVVIVLEIEACLAGEVEYKDDHDDALVDCLNMSTLHSGAVFMSGSLWRSAGLAGSVAGAKAANELSRRVCAQMWPCNLCESDRARPVCAKLAA